MGHSECSPQHCQGSSSLVALFLFFIHPKEAALFRQPLFSVFLPQTKLDTSQTLPILLQLLTSRYNSHTCHLLMASRIANKGDL